MKKRSSHRNTRVHRRIVSTPVHPVLQPLPQVSVPQSTDYGKSVIIIAVALTMLISVVGTFVVLNELSTVEKSINALQAHRALNAMLVRQQEKTVASTVRPPVKPQVVELSGQASVTILPGKEV